MQELILEEKTTLSPVMKEIYRRLRTNLEFTGIENKVICLTSCMENDGKSSVSFNLAKILAENDKRVLFIDADMRNSVLTKRTGIADDLKGLSHYLAGKNAASEVIYATNYKNFYVIPTGRFPKNPTELLNKPAYEVLIEGMKQTFDYVIIDTPPLGLLEDKNLVVKDVVVQSSERNLYGRSVRLDALCVLGNGKKCNVEVQRSDNDDHLRRVRFNAASIAVKDSQEGEKFEQIEDIIVVYISQFDIFKADRVLYHVDSTIRETGNRVDDGLYRVFVNTEVKDGTTVSEYMECFLKKEVNNSKFPAFTKRMNALKHEERGLNAVCEVMEKYEQKAVEEGLSLFEKAITMLASGKSPSEVVLTGVPQNIVDRASRAMKPKLNK